LLGGAERLFLSVSLRVFKNRSTDDRPTAMPSSVAHREAPPASNPGAPQSAPGPASAYGFQPPICPGATEPVRRHRCISLITQLTLIKLLGRRAPRRATLNRRDKPLTQVLRERLRHSIPTIIMLRTAGGGGRSGQPSL
jgi:hypothetical protein